ncbi:probable E3 ubiquitin-protein ligase RHG1A [Capsicum annuum]|uniref:probable E3 ubiquitin-protein ligase RHG1A n=1 Tax=Capsicum annuum TaxID=4072 RepID=UPI001FB19904|nr:probable E3 ubiquitin-protein ligase RHG1A [Capsicum annuum]
MSSEAQLGLQKYLESDNAWFRVKAFYLSAKLYKYELVKSTCPEIKEQRCICLEEYYDGEQIAGIHCGHVYHVRCIKEWVKLKNCCPVCRSDALAILT